MASKNRLDQAAGASIGGFFSKSDESKPEQEQTAKESRKPPYTDEQMDEALKTVYRTGKQQDGADYLQINKGTFSKKIREIEEKEPERVERLKAEVEKEATDKALAEVAGTSVESIRDTRLILEKGTPEQIERAEKGESTKKIIDEINAQKPQIAPELQEPIKSTPAEEKAEKKANTKQKKQVFSFRATLDNIADWKAYATATGQTMENVGTAAMNEYLDRHKLTGAEQAIFEAMKSKNEK